jgi:hypothetical protein
VDGAVKVFGEPEWPMTQQQQMAVVGQVESLAIAN